MATFVEREVDGEVKRFYQIRISKAKADVELCFADLPEEVYEQCLVWGAEHYANGGMTKITKNEIPDDEERQEKALEVGSKRIADMLKGDIKIPGKKAEGKASREVMVEARRLAKAYLVDILKRSGIKHTTVPAKTKTQLANEIIEGDPDIVKLAMQNVEEKKKKASSIKSLDDLLKDPSKIVSQQLVEKNKKRSAKASEDAVLSVTQAGLIKPKAPAVRPTAH